MLDPKIAPVAQAESEDASKVSALIAGKEIRDDDGLREAVAWTAEIKSKWAEVDEKRKGFTDPLRRVIDEINAFFRPALESLKEAEAGLKAKILEHVEGRLQGRKEALAEVAGMPDVAKRAIIVQHAEALLPPKISGLSIRESWTGELVDPLATIDWCITEHQELLLVHVKGLEALTKAAGRDPGIPGWRAFVKQTVAIGKS